MAVNNLMNEMNSAIVATVAGLVVGVVMKFATKWTDRRKDNLAEHLELRRELREELDIVKEDVYRMQKDLDEWREKYYHQLEINATLQSEISILRLELEEYKETTGEHGV